MYVCMPVTHEKDEVHTHVHTHVRTYARSVDPAAVVIVTTPLELWRICCPECHSYAGNLVWVSSLVRLKVE